MTGAYRSILAAMMVAAFVAASGGVVSAALAAPGGVAPDGAAGSAGLGAWGARAGSVVLAAADAADVPGASGSSGSPVGSGSVGGSGVPVLAAAAAMPGRLISTGPLPEALGVPGKDHAVRILYTSTDGVTGQGEVTVSGAVFYPSGTAPKAGWPVVAWAHGTVGIGDACAPSANPRSERDAAYLAAWLKRGFAVVSTDYQGLGMPGMHPYLNARSEAYGVLDSVRAALAGLPDLDNRVVVVGQSQGAGAAFAASAYAPEYAPHLRILGTVATGIPYIQASSMQAALSRPQSGPVTAGAVASGQVAPGVQAGGAGAASAGGKVGDPILTYMLLLGASEGGIVPAFKPEAAFSARAMPFYTMAATACLGPFEQAVDASGLTRATALLPGFPAAMMPAFKAMAFPTLKLSQPLFVGTGAADIDVPATGQLELVRDACAAGTPVEAHLYKGLAHSPTVMASLPDSGAFVHKLLNGVPITPICTPVAQ